MSDAKVPVVVSRDTGREDDPYEQFLSGSKYSSPKNVNLLTRFL